MIRKKILTLILTLLIVFISLFLFLNYNSEGTNKKQELEVKQAEELSENEFEKIKEDYIALLNRENPKIALSRVLEDTSTNSALLRSCHSLAHNLGHAAYEKYQDFGEALKYQDEICNSGYLHGVIESHFALSTNISDTIQTVCNKYDVKNFTGWQCYHGVGHGLMFFNNNDLPKSIAICETYKNGLAKSSCVNGVFMENFNTDQKLHKSKFLKTEDPFYPCKEQNEENKKDCYIYTPVYFLTLNNNYLDALNWCKSAEEGYQSVCIAGVGSQAIKENINNPKLVEKICMTVDKKYISSCISGMVNLYIYHFGSTKKAQELCSKLERENTNICQNDVNLIKNNFNI